MEKKDTGPLTPQQKSPAAPASGTSPSSTPANQDEKIRQAQEEQIQKLLATMADNNPEGVAEIIRMWLNEDKKKA